MITRDLADTINTKIQSLSVEQQHEVLNFVEYLIEKAERQKARWDQIINLTVDISKETWAPILDNSVFQDN